MSFLLLLYIQIAYSLNLRYNGTINDLWNVQQTNCYGVIFDAGSSGTRVYVYSWDCRETQTMPYISLSEQSIEKKVKPGISTFANKIDEIYSYLQPLIEFATNNLPTKMKQYTPIMLGATAGMRLLDEQQQEQIVKEIRRIFNKSGFLFLSEQWARVISGMEEGAYMWLSINYLLNRMISQNQVLTIDLGGASTQISFKPNTTIEENEMNLIIPNLNQYHIYSQSYLYYGMDQALIQIHKQNYQDNETKIITSPCYFSGYENIYEYDNTFTVLGVGNYNECALAIKKYLNNEKENCIHSNCGVNGSYQPIIDSEDLYGLSGVQSMVDLFNLENFTLSEYYQKVTYLTSLSWSDVELIPEYINNPYISTDYFSSIYVYHLLQYGYGIQEDKIIHSPETIKGITPVWTVAALFYQLSQIQCQYDSPICVSIINK